MFELATGGVRPIGGPDWPKTVASGLAFITEYNIRNSCETAAPNNCRLAIDLRSVRYD